MPKELPLVNWPHPLLLSEEDYEWARHLEWEALLTRDRTAVATVRMRHFSIAGNIMKPDKGIWVDHIDRNPLNNTRENLRLCTRQQNQWNRSHKPTESSPYKGVSKQRGKWRTEITKDGKRHYLGTYDSKEKAALAYNEAAKELFGEFANLNVVEEGEGGGYSPSDKGLIVALSGKQRAGKDEVANFLMALGLHKRFRREALAKALKAEVAAHLGITVELLESRKTEPHLRKELIHRGVVLRQGAPHHLTDLVLASNPDNPQENLLITDVRYLTELQRIEQDPRDHVFLRVEASRENRASRGILSNEDDASETELDSISDWDYIIHNDKGKWDLLKQLEPIVQDILGRVDKTSRLS